MDKVDRIAFIVLSVAVIITGAVNLVQNIDIDRLQNRWTVFEDGSYIVKTRDGQELKGCLEGQLCAEGEAKQ